MKELDLTEGRSTGVPTIQEELAGNGSPRATFETTEERLTFLIHIPAHEGCGDKPIVMNGSETTTERATEKIIRMIKKNLQITNKELAEDCCLT